MFKNKGSKCSSAVYGADLCIVLYINQITNVRSRMIFAMMYPSESICSTCHEFRLSSTFEKTFYEELDECLEQQRMLIPFQCTLSLPRVLSGPAIS